MSLAAKTTHGSVPVMVGAFKTLYVPGDEPVPGYVLIAPLGRGQSGEVWKANGPGVEVAVKIVNLAERIGQKELRALRRIKDIKHPNLMPIYGFWLKTASGKTLGESQLQESAVGGLARTRVLAASDQTLIPDSFPEKLAADETPVQLIIAMGLGSQTLGDRLDACVKQGLPGIPRGDLLDFMQSAAMAIDFLNVDHDIQHCDIKPNNLLLVGNGLQVCDFGVAKATGEDVRKTDPGFTPFYAPPELIQSEEPSPATDQYALAVTYAELRTGRLPFPSAVKAFYEAKAAHRLDLEGLPPVEQEVIRQATSSNPEDRYPTCQAFVSALRQSDSKTIDQEPVTEFRHRYHPGEVPVPGYKLERLLGEGGAGQVWRAIGAGVEVALKVVNLNRKIGNKELEALRLIQGRNFPNLVSIYGFWLRDSAGRIVDGSQIDLDSTGSTDRVQGSAFLPIQLIIVMGLGDSTLDQRLAECKQGEHARGIPRQELLRYLETAAKAIDFLNKKDIQHCDVKPSNLLLVGGEVQVCDYGLAQATRAGDAQQTSIAYSLPYAAPELIEGKLPTSTTDQFSLAITYAELLTGELPYPADMPIEQAQVEGKIDLSKLPRRDRAVIRRATSVNPSKRFKSNQEMAAALKGKPVPLAIWLAGFTVCSVAAVLVAWAVLPKQDDGKLVEQINVELSRGEESGFVGAWTLTDSLSDATAKQARKQEVIEQWYAHLADGAIAKLETVEESKAIKRPLDSFLKETSDPQLTGMNVNHARHGARAMRAWALARVAADEGASGEATWQEAALDLREVDVKLLPVQDEDALTARCLLLRALLTARNPELLPGNAEFLDDVQRLVEIWKGLSQSDRGVWTEAQYNRLLREVLVDLAKRLEPTTAEHAQVIAVLGDAGVPALRDIQLSVVHDHIQAANEETFADCRAILNGLDAMFQDDESKRLVAFHEVALDFADPTKTWAEALEADRRYQLLFPDAPPLTDRQRGLLLSQMELRLQRELNGRSDPSTDQDQILKHHQRYQALGGKDTLTDAYRIEALVSAELFAPAPSRQPLPDSQWTEFFAWANGTQLDSPHESYLHYVRGLVFHRQDRGKSVAERQDLREVRLAVESQPAAAWTKSRRHRMAMILIDSASRLAIEEHEDRAYLPLGDEEVANVYPCLRLAYQLMESDLDTLDEAARRRLFANLAVVALIAQSSGDAADVASCSEVIGYIDDYERSRSNPHATLLLVKAACRARLGDQAKAIGDYASALHRWWDASPRGTTSHASQVMQQVVDPALSQVGLKAARGKLEQPSTVQLATNLVLDDDRLRADAAFIFHVKADLLRSDAEIQKESGGQYKKQAYLAALQAALLQPNSLPHIEGLGLSYHEFAEALGVDQSVQLEELTWITGLAQGEMRKLEPMRGLRGYVQVLKSRLTISLDERKEYLDRALREFEAAIPAQDVRANQDNAAYLIGLSASELELAFVLNKLKPVHSQARQHLEHARDHAHQATDPELPKDTQRRAWYAKGHAEEDLGHYFKLIESFADAEQSFLNASRLAAFTGESPHESTLSRLRTRYRKFLLELESDDRRGGLAQDLEAVANALEKLSQLSGVPGELTWNATFWLGRVRATQLTIEKDADRKAALEQQAREAFRAAISAASAARSVDWSVFQVDWFGFETGERRLQLAQEIVDAGFSRVRDDALLAAVETIAAEGKQSGAAASRISLIIQQAALSAPGKSQYLIARLNLLRAREILKLAAKYQSDSQRWDQLALTSELTSLGAPHQHLAAVQTWAQGLADPEVRKHFEGRAALYLGMASFYLSLREFSPSDAAASKVYADAARTQLAASDELLRDDPSPEAKLSHEEAVDWLSRVQTWRETLETSGL